MDFSFFASEVIADSEVRVTRGCVRDDQVISPEELEWTRSLIAERALARPRTRG